MRRVLSLFACCFFMLCGQVYADFESEVIELVNVERAAEGIAPLSYDARLAAAARGHSEDMGLQDYFDHDSLDGRHFYDRIQDAGYAYNYCGENIAAGYSTPEAVVQGWMNSSGHRANILNGGYSRIGTAAYESPDGTVYWCQQFLR